MTILIITAISVSIDSFVCGFSLSGKVKIKALKILCIVLTVFLMCLLANYVTELFDEIFTETTSSLGGLILIGVGVYNLIKKNDATNSDIDGKHNALLQTILTGFAVGLDGALANLSLSIMGNNEFYVPIIIALMHGIMISLGALLVKIPFIKNVRFISYVAPIALIVLGSYKLLGLFI